MLNRSIGSFIFDFFLLIFLRNLTAFGTSFPNFLNLDQFGATSHCSNGKWTSTQLLLNEFDFLNACALVWIVLIDLFDQVLFILVFQSKIVNGTEKIPTIVTESVKGASCRVDTSQHVE